MKSAKRYLNYNYAIVLIIAIIMFAAGVLYTKAHYNVNKQNLINNQNSSDNRKAERYGKVIKVKPEKLEYYKMLHAKPWPEVLEALHECNLRDFSIYYKDGFLFSYYEYIGDDYDKDMKILSEKTKKWLEETDPCQEPVESAKPGEWWSLMEEVFHMN
jgi:L-rhamnose mutarotase